MQKITTYLLEHEYETVNFSYPSTRYSIEQLVEKYLHELFKQPRVRNAGALNFVTHSMSSLMLRYYLSLKPINNLSKWVMIAPPNHGSEVAQWMKHWWFYRFKFGPAGQQLGIDEQGFCKRLPEDVNAEFAVITGNRSNNAWFSKQINGPNDSRVSVESAKLPGMKDFLVLPYHHSEIVRVPETHYQVEHFLQYGVFDH